MNSIHDRVHRNAFPSMAHLKRKALPLSLSLLGMVTGSLLPWSEAAGAGPTAGTLPTGGVVVSGSANISTTGTTLTVTQSSAQAAMNWTSFDIASNASVVFSQPSANAIALNRIGIGSSTPAASQIFGSLSANGQVFLINPAGIVFGAAASVNVGGLVASTLDMDPATLAGGSQRFHLDNNTGTGASVVNHGTITAATGGGVVLAGGSVSNDGMILASAGHIFLDGADHATLDFDGNNLINVTVTGGLASGSGTAVNNSGTLQSDGGTVVLQASATPGLFSQMVNNAGVIKAESLSGAGGTVQLIGTGGGVTNSGQISVNGTNGGNVAITSDQAVNAGGTITATGGSTGSLALSGSALTLGGAIDAGGGQISLTSGGSTTQTAGSLSGATLTGSSVDATTLAQSGNAITSLSNYESGGNLTLATSGSLALAGNVSGNAVTLNAAAITEAAGAVFSANSLAGGSTGSTVLNQANQLGTLGNYTTGGNFTLVNGQAITQSGALRVQGSTSLSAGSNSITLSNGNNALLGSVRVTGGNTQINCASALTFGASAITGNLIATTANAGINQIGALNVTGTSTFNAGAGAIALTNANNTLATSTGQTVNATGTGIAITNSGDLHVGMLADGANGAVSLVAGGLLYLPTTAITTGTADLTLVSNGGVLATSANLSGNNVTLSGSQGITLAHNVTAANTFNLTSSNGAISQTAGTLAANTLTGTSQNATTLSQFNQVAQLGNFSANGFSLSSSGALAITGAVNSSTVALNVIGALTETTGGSVTASSLTGSSTGATALNQTNNQITQLGGFTANGFSLYNAGALSVAGPLNSTGNVALTSQSGDLTLAGTVSGTGVTLQAHGGAIAQLAGGLTATTLTGASQGSTTLTQSGNQVSRLGGFSANGFSLTDANALTVSGPLNSTGDVTLTSLGGDLSLAGALNGANVVLTAGNGAVNQAAGSLTATSLSGQSSGMTSLTQSGNAINQLGSYSSGGDFDLTNSVALTQSGPLRVLGNTTLDAGTHAIMLGNNGNDLHGAVSLLAGNTQIANDRALTFGTSTLSGNLDATTANAIISQAGALSVAGASTFNAGTGAIALGNSANQLQGAVSLNGSDAQIANGRALVLGTSTLSGSLGANTANGAISQSGVLSVAGTSTFNAGTGSITLNNGANELLGRISINGGDTWITSGLAMILGASTISGNLVATTANTLITQTGALNVAGASVFNAGSGAITLNNRTNSLQGAVSVIGGDTQIANSGALVFGTSSITGNLGATAVDAAISQTGSIKVMGASVFDAGTGAITLSHIGNELHGPVSFSGADTVVANDRDLVLGASTISGNLGVTAANATISQSGRLNVSGTSTFDAGTGTISLGSNDNALVGAVSLIGGNAQIANGRALVFGASHLSGNLDAATDNAAISQTGALSVAGTSALDAGTGTITLDRGNDLRGAVSLIGGDTEITNGGPLLFGASQINGNLSVTTTDPAIGQSGALSVTGNSYFDAGTGSIALTDANNRLGGQVSATGTGIAITNAGDLRIAALSNGANGAVSLVSVNGTLILPGTAIAAGTSDLSLMSGGGVLATAGALSGANVALSGSGGVSLGHDVSATNELNVVSSNGAITQTGGVLNAGTLTGGSYGSANLSQANLVRNVGSFSANGFSMNNAASLTILGPVSSTGDVSLTTQHGDLTLAGLLSGNSVTLNIAGAINEEASGSLVATTLSGSAGGATSLGTHDQPASNRIGTLGRFTSPAGFSLTNDQTLTLASVNGSTYTVDAGTSSLYLWVRDGDLLQIGTTPLYDGKGTFAASNRIGTAAAPLYVFGTQPQVVEFVGNPPAYFYAVDRQGNPLTVIGGQSRNLTASLSYGRERSAIHRQDSYIDTSAVTQSGHQYGIVAPGIRLPRDLSACVPHPQADCRSN
ncbi:filamentous hemagglutinin N-terminal domain-containing protein [Dyella amyloliquefaciens]|uniref:two-partner secretion domain-containing protein n=1 Tax=Dyella amyloliquefaciens TaxID=1770545 RepID=UPI0013EEB284|nr:filamentous hemagglutinin N-terminal domain-containing protein [Dyella amyloliquefaciens]